MGCADLQISKHWLRCPPSVSCCLGFCPVVSGGGLVRYLWQRGNSMRAVSWPQVVTLNAASFREFVRRMFNRREARGEQVSLGRGWRRSCQPGAGMPARRLLGLSGCCTLS